MYEEFVLGLLILVEREIIPQNGHAQFLVNLSTQGHFDPFQGVGVYTFAKA